jgi:hypothetical protein
VDVVHVIGDVCQNLGYSYTECCFTKYGANFHIQSFVGYTYAAYLALEYPVPAGSGFSTKTLFGKPLLTSVSGLPDTDYGGSMIFQNVGVCLPTDMA